jgi:hypothetical protein
VELPTVRATYAGGDLNASAVVDQGKLTFFGTLADANFSDSIRIFSDFLDRTSPPPADAKPDADPNDSLAAELEGGRLNLQMSASGQVEDFQSYEGTGTMRITEAELGKVKLFGLLADVLGSIGLKVGVLNFHTAESSIEVKHEHLIFPDMRITGDTGALEPKGEYNLDKESLDFRARLYPLRASNGTLTQIFGVMLDPFSNFFEVRLTGSLAKPRWAPTLSAIELIKRLTAPPPEEPETPTVKETPEGVEPLPPQAEPATPASPSPETESTGEPAVGSYDAPVPESITPPSTQAY